jgi:hypothetical protein
MVKYLILQPHPKNKKNAKPVQYPFWVMTPTWSEEGYIEGIFP